MITLKIEDLTIKQIIKICKDQPSGTCNYCPIQKYCNANFVGQPKSFNYNVDDEDTVSVDVNKNEA